MNNLELSNPVAWTDADELADMDCNTYGNIFNAKYIDIHNGRWLPLYSQGYIDFLIAQLEAAQKERDEMNGILNIERGGSAFASKRTTHIDAMRDKWQARAKKAEAALSAASDKLSKPVVLPVGYAVRAGHPINEGERNVMIPKEGGNWLSRFDVEHAIRVAGFTVEGE
ncbi:hypothetical protein PGS49_09215 [Yersinia intermedia]|uniref:hypothetical protein n=1 Tax=Yersinia intermedia TaxID=631 RepID=UPI0022FF2FAC|nr:hypothetical protein [Yersinia intermedia]MDA5480838.1 hypothetical protein [Yersinia intermedia]